MNYLTTIFLTFVWFFFSALRTQSFAEVPKEESLVCNQQNYLDYIHNKDKTNELIKSTGRGCDLSGAKLRMLRGAYLREANLEEANLIGADLRDVSEANFSKAVYDDKTNFPGLDFMFNPKEKGMISWEELLQKVVDERGA